MSARDPYLPWNVTDADIDAGLEECPPICEWCGSQPAVPESRYCGDCQSTLASIPALCRIDDCLYRLYGSVLPCYVCRRVDDEPDYERCGVNLGSADERFRDPMEVAA